jgi:tetratricopeptide (TPR) repeat protein
MNWPSKLLLAGSLALLSCATSAQTADAQPVVDSARAAARADRNREAADLFGAAMAQAPQRRRELLQEYADQLLYSQRARDAIPLYHEILEHPRTDDERRSARKGVGLAFLWTDQPFLARPHFEALVREQPEDADVSRNLGRALSWSGRQREAVSHLRQHLTRHPQDGEARVQLAQAQAWMGRPDAALASLDGLDSKDAGKLRAALERELAPRTHLGAERSAQSDDLDIRAWRLGQVVAFGQGRGSLGLRLERVDYEREDRTDGAHVQRPVVLGRYRLSDAFEWNGEAGREHIRLRGGRASESTVYNTWLTWWPSDLVRFDLSASRSDFDNLRSLRQAIMHRDTGISMDVTPDDRQRYTARLQRMDVSDGNRRRMAQMEGEYRWRTHPDIWLGARYTQFEFDRQLDHGYFNPLRFRSLLVTARALWRPGGDGGRWEFGAYAAAGREEVTPDGDKPVHDLSLRAAYRIDPATRLELRAQRFSSRTSAATGFARTTFGMGLERSW